ncbi:MAG: hypothetical protein LBR26_11595 [Prevotella sp.]|nr:hypothetical protein [Prevotella sp.]
MKNLLLLFVLILSVSGVFSQDLEKMPKAEREVLLIKRAKELVLRHGPGYWREYQPPVIERSVFTGKTGSGSKYIGQIYYRITILYNPKSERFNCNYAAVVDFWAITGKPWGISFGNGLGFVFDDNYEEKIKSGQVEVMPFQTMDDQIREEKERYRRKGWKWEE